MRYIKFLLVPMLFVSLAFMNVGGCGSSGGGNSQPTKPPPTDPPPTQPPPTDPPPDVCELPGLGTDFSDFGYFFFDDVTGLLVGVTSNGELVTIAITDSFGVSVGAGADVVTDFACLIFAGIVGDAVLDAEGLCGKSDDSTLFLILDFEILGVPFVDTSVSECFEVVPLGGVSVAEDVSTALENVSREMVAEKQERGEIDADNPDYVSIGDGLDELEQQEVQE